MAQATMTQTILRAIGETLSPVIAKYYYLTRPSTFPAEVKEFAVISLPTVIRRSLFGYSDSQSWTTGIIYVYSKAKTNNTPNIGRLTSLSEAVEKLFPIGGDGFACKNPDLQYMGADDYGYQVSRISFRIYIKKNTIND